MKVSVVVPTYNRAHQISDTLRSVIAQSHPPDEILVIDDGSTDDTEAVCAEFRHSVRYERQANGGVSAARNHGAALATGDVLAFVDSDDLWHVHKLAVQCAALESREAVGWSLTGCDVIDLEGRPIPGRSGFAAVFGVFSAAGMEPDEFFKRYFESYAVTVQNTTYSVYAGDAFDPLFLGNFGLPSSFMVRRDVFRAAGGFDPAFRLAEETEFFHRLAARSHVAIVAAPLVGYRVGQAGSLISPANTRTLIENALRSAGQAAALRTPTEASERHRLAGRIELLRKLAYANLSLKEGAGARHALREAWRSGAARDGRSIALFAASWLPGSVLGLLHGLKRAARDVTGAVR